ncbi:hypothetical protein N7493_004890 [Penicillium malachiteum]|uniref:Uncharacterized protein n=1 Tax=Penicillium malachiteum TaxID=1324776 RepID=A0AAD6HM18_9EURO|nr:hypothetical protein N7493_004890 [Penicillium malachiteum]
MTDSNICDKCHQTRRDESRDFQNHVFKAVIGFITMTLCFLLLRLFFPGALAKSVSNMLEIAGSAVGYYTDRLTSVDSPLYAVNIAINEGNALESYQDAFVNERILCKKTQYDCNYPSGGIRLAY